MKLDINLYNYLKKIHELSDIDSDFKSEDNNIKLNILHKKIEDIHNITTSSILNILSEYLFSKEDNTLEYLVNNSSFTENRIKNLINEMIKWFSEGDNQPEKVD